MVLEIDLLRRNTDVEMFLKILILFITAHLNQHIVNTISIKKIRRPKLGFKTVKDLQEMTADDQVQSERSNKSKAKGQPPTETRIIRSLVNKTQNYIIL